LLTVEEVLYILLDGRMEEAMISDELQRDQPFHPHHEVTYSVQSGTKMSDTDHAIEARQTETFETSWRFGRSVLPTESISQNDLRTIFAWTSQGISSSNAASSFTSS